jgi:hypothetical protein
LRCRSSRQCAALSVKSRVVRKDECWSDAKRDDELAGCETQLWQVDPCNEPRSGRRPYTLLELVPISSQSLPCMGSYRYDLHWHDGLDSCSGTKKASRTLDALGLTWTGIMAGTDGGVDSDWKKERMGAGYVTGTEREMQTPLSARVGGPLSPLREEATSLLSSCSSCSLILISMTHDASTTPLLVFADCLVLLAILQRWQQASLHPHRADVVHYGVVSPLKMRENELMYVARRAPASGRPAAAGQGEGPHAVQMSGQSACCRAERAVHVRRPPHTDQG